MSYKLSKEYARLYDLICKGETIVCFVNYDWDRKGDIVRDVCLCKRHKDFDIQFSSRGMGYGGVDTWHKAGPLNETELFVKVCKCLNVEFIDPEN